MSYSGFFALCGQEIVNNARAITYARAAGVAWGDCDPCIEYLAQAECGPDEEYTNAVDDEAPWIDMDRPESLGFYGVLGVSVGGLMNNPIERKVTENPGEGSAIGPVRRKHREIAFTVNLLAADRAALSYGIEWLAAALMPGGCDITCGGCEAEFYAFCPCTPDCFGNYGTSERRTIQEAALLEGPSVGEVELMPTTCTHTGSRCGMGPLLATVTFTIIAGRPRIFGPAIGGGAAGCVYLADGIHLTDYDPEKAVEDCPEPVDDNCGRDPDCPLPEPPPRPTAPVDPCFPRGPFDAVASYITVPGTCVGEWNELFPVIGICAGEKPLRRLTIRFRINPAGVRCEDSWEPCNLCMDVTLPYLEAGAALTIDTRVQKARITCHDGTPLAVTKPASLYGTGGTGFTWPVIHCPTGVCVEVIAADDGTHELGGATAHVTLYPAADAG